MSEKFYLPSDYREIDTDIRQEALRYHSLDGYPLTGILYLPPKKTPDVAVLAMHPRGDFARHYLAAGLPKSGYAFFGANTRNIHNDADAIHERLMLDVGAAVKLLRDRGFKKVILAGNSGGGSLMALYLHQSSKKPADRYDSAPSGDKIPLRETELPAADGFVIIAAHPGEGRFLLERLDPSVVDETNPTAVNPRLDMYDPRNGYRPMSQGPSKYSKDFLAEFRAAQKARCERIDRQCLEWSEESFYYRAKMKDPNATPAEKLRASRHGLQRRYIVIYRTLADPRYLDPTLDPSRRPLGSIFAYGGRDPVAANYGEGLARSMSARGWLSTWSGLSSRAELERTAPGVSVPALMIYADADTEIYEPESREIFKQLGSKDKTFVTLDWADHYLFPVGEGLKMKHPRERLFDEMIVPWLKQRWAV